MDDFYAARTANTTALPWSNFAPPFSAIDGALKSASKSIRNLDWFEVISTRGYIEDGKVGYYQVVLEIGFKYEDKP